MRKLIFIFLLLPLLSITQEEKIDFTNKLVYEMKSEYETITIKLYYSPKGSILEASERRNSSTAIIKDQLFTPLNINLDRIANFPKYSRADSIPSFTLLKTNKKDNVYGVPCNYYDVKIDNKSDEEIKMCIAENNPLNLLGVLPNKNKNINGLIVKIGSEKGNGEWFELKSIDKINSYITIDWKKVKAEIEENLNERYSYMMTDSVTTEIKTIPDEYPIEAPDIEVNRYNSEYKVEKTEVVDLAIAHLEKNSLYWNGIPAYCKELDEKVSVFRNEKLKKHARNYAGQLCNLYLSEIKEYSVDIRGTLDEIRYEENYFRNTSLDKKEKELLNRFLNKLD